MALLSYTISGKSVEDLQTGGKKLYLFTKDGQIVEASPKDNVECSQDGIFLIKDGKRIDLIL